MTTRNKYVIVTPAVEGNKHNFKRKKCMHKFIPVHTYGINNYTKCSKCGNVRIR